MGEIESDGFEKTSKYNSAIAQLYRLDALWRDAHNHKRQGLFYEWDFDLDCIWSELSRDFETNEQKSWLNKYSRVIISVYKAKKISHNHWYHQLLTKEIFIGWVQNKIGKGTAYDDGDDEEAE